MLLRDLVAASDAVGATRSRREKASLLARCLRALEPGEAAAGAVFLSGETRQRQLGVGWASLRDLPPPAAAASLNAAEVDAALAGVGAASGPGSQALRRAALERLFARATEAEARFLRGLVLGELRQGALESLVADALADASGVPRAELRRALMLAGDLGTVAELALTQGGVALRALRLEPGRPLQPMLAGSAADVEAALERIRPAAIEWKLDGARIQVHRRDGEVRVFTRSLDEVTDRVPELVEAALALPVRCAVLDGEAIALRGDGRPHPFQVTGSRFASRRSLEELRRSLPLQPFFFDLLHLDGEDLLDREGRERWAALETVVPEPLRVPRALVDDAYAASRFLRDALERGHEGVMLKSLSAPYAAGRRGAGWLKVKPRHTLDLVVLAAEWGHGRRRGRLSNLHLGARAGGGEGYVMLGKTFKGLTDEMLAWQTERLLELERERDQWTVHVRPELVVEIAFDGVQRSSRYPGGVALRFARVVRYRDDKNAAGVDDLATVRAFLPAS